MIDVDDDDIAGADKVLVYLQFAGSGGSHTYRGGIIANPMNGLGNFEVVTSFRLHSTSAVMAPDGIPSTAPASATKNGMWIQLTSELNGSNVATVSPVPLSRMRPSMRPLPPFSKPALVRKSPSSKPLWRISPRS